MIYFLCLVLACSLSHGAVLHPALRRSLRNEGKCNVMVIMKKNSESIIHSVRPEAFHGRTEMITSMTDDLEKNARDSQASVRAVLMREQIDFGIVNSFWISNRMSIQDAPANLVEQLLLLDEVEEIRPEMVLSVEEFNMHRQENTTAVEWGIEKINADDVWDLGNTGEGVVIAITDTGVDGQHEALKDSYVGSEHHGWFDPYTGTAEPEDLGEHGTHVMGTIAGSHGIGVAPGVQWMACVGCTSDICTEPALMACAQWTLCPHDAQGNNKDCSKAPRLSSNSWGGGPGLDFYLETIAAWRKAGIIPVFSNGNAGPACGTAGSPGDYDDVIGVGASTVEDGLARFSSKGPSFYGKIKPDVSAPGYLIRSAKPGGGYQIMSGTSMACPHVSGAISLLLSKDPTMDYDQVYAALTTTANTDGLTQTGTNCGDISEDEFPNNAYGHGVIDILQAVKDANPPTPAPTTPTPTTPTPTPENPNCHWNFWKFRCSPKEHCKWSWKLHHFGCVRR